VRLDEKIRGGRQIPPVLGIGDALAGIVEEPDRPVGREQALRLAGDVAAFGGSPLVLDVRGHERSPLSAAAPANLVVGSAIRRLSIPALTEMVLLSACRSLQSSGIGDRRPSGRTMTGHTSHSELGHTWRTGQTSARPLDEVDRRILSELSSDARMSMRTLAERVHVSRANVYSRVERLMADGVITRFSVQVDPERAGLGTSAYVLLSIQQNTWRDVASALGALPYVEHFALVGGDFDVLALVRAPNNAELRHVVLERIQDVPGVRGTRTWLVFDEHLGKGDRWA
jgi:DNA-binding Lrp family transcriptional regulator